jgi:hypothetical protein
MALTKTTFSMTEGQVINVVDYGAVVDGNEITGTGTDNALAIQAALNAVNDTYGGAVYFPRGIYATTKGFRVKARTVILGDGWDASMVMLHKDTTDLSATADAMFYVDGPPIIFPELPMRYVHFRKIALHGLDYVIPAGNFFGIKFRRAQYSTVVDCEIKSFWRDGIVFTHAAGEESNTSCVVSGCMIRDNNSDGVVLQKANNIQILNNIIRTNSGSGIEFEGDPSLRTRITNNLFHNNLSNAVLCAALTNYGVNVVNSPGSDGTAYVDIIANKFYANGSSTDDPSEEYLGAVHATNVKYWNISSNSFSSVQEHGIYIGGDHVNISDNYFVPVVRNGIETAPGSSYIDIKNNSMVACGYGTANTYYGIKVAGSIINVDENTVAKDTSISTNLVKYAIQIESGSTVIEVSNNNTIDAATTDNFNTDATSVVLGKNQGQSVIPQVASATAIAIPFGATFLRVTGTTTITEITKAAAHKGYTIVLVFDASLTVANKTTGTTNLRLAGAVDFSATANDTLTLISNGTDWYEVARSVN